MADATIVLVHGLAGLDGWEDVADDALNCAVEQVKTPTPTARTT